LIKINKFRRGTQNILKIEILIGMRIAKWSTRRVAWRRERGKLTVSVRIEKGGRVRKLRRYRLQSRTHFQWPRRRKSIFGTHIQWTFGEEGKCSSSTPVIAA